jgi:hypothetical protein
MNGAGGSSGRVSGRSVASGVTARARAVEQASAEVLRLEEGVQFAVPALSAIGDSARRLSRYSARVRVLELEVLPAGPYLGHCVRLLHDELVTQRAPREWSARMTPRVDEVQVMLERAIDVTASIDIPGELGLPLELVSTVQSGARAGLSCLGRLRSILQVHDPSNAPREFGQQVPEFQPSVSAQWLVHTASGLLPPGSRDRYREEFASELLGLAEARAGSRAQLGHAARQVAAIWALRRALPSATPRPVSPDRIRAPLSTDHDTVPQPRLRDHVREPVDRWLTRRHARKVLREQVRIQHAKYAHHRLPSRRGRHRRY